MLNQIINKTLPLSSDFRIILIDNDNDVRIKESLFIIGMWRQKILNQVLKTEMLDIARMIHEPDRLRRLMTLML